MKSEQHPPIPCQRKLNYLQWKYLTVHQICHRIRLCTNTYRFQSNFQGYKTTLPCTSCWEFYRMLYCNLGQYHTYKGSVNSNFTGKGGLFGDCQNKPGRKTDLRWNLRNQEQLQHDICHEFSTGIKGHLYLLPSFNRVSRGNEWRSWRA